MAAMIAEAGANLPRSTPNKRFRAPRIRLVAERFRRV